MFHGAAGLKGLVISQRLSGSGLRARLEAAREGNRALDLAICIALNTGRSTNPRNLGAPAYTSSLDAAMMLVPEGFLWSVDTLDAFPEACVAGPGPIGPDSYISAATPALALCIAALKAQEHSQ